MNTNEFEDARISTASGSNVEQSKRAILKIAASYERVLNLEKNSEIPEGVKQAIDNYDNETLLYEKGDIPSVLKGTGAFLYPLATLLDSDDIDLSVSKQYNKILESKFLQVAKEKQALQLKLWSEKEYQSEFESMMTKMITVVKDNNYSINQYVSKTKERMQDVEAELRVEDNEFWNRISEQDNAIRRIRGLYQELTTKIFLINKDVVENNKKISEDLLKKDEIVSSLSGLLESMEDHYEDMDLNDILSKLDSQTQELENLNKEIRSLSADISKIQKDTMILEDLRGFLKQEEQKFFSYRNRLEMYDSKGVEIDSNTSTLTSKEELGNFALERKIEKQSAQIETMSALQEEHEKKIKEQADIIQEYEDKYTGNRLEARLRDIEKQYDVAKSEIEKYKTQEKLYRDKIRKLLINRGIEYIEDMYDSMADDRKKLIEYEKDIQVLTNNCEEYKTIAKSLQEEQENMQKMMSEKQVSLNKELSSKQASIDKQIEEIKELNTLLSSKDNTNANLMNHIEQLRNDYDSLNQKYNNALSENELLLSNKQKEFEISKVEYENTIQSLRSTLDENSLVIKQQETEKETSHNEIDRLKKQLETKTSEIDVLTSDKKQNGDHYEEKLSTLVSQLKSAQDDYKQYKDEMESKYQMVLSDKGVDMKEVEVYKKQIESLENSLTTEKDKFMTMSQAYAEEKKKYEETLEKNAQIIADLKKKTVTTESDNKKASIEEYQKRIQELMNDNDSLQSKLNQKDAIYKDNLNKQIELYESLKNDFIKNNSESSENSPVNHDKCNEIEKNLSNENIVLKNEIEKLKLEATNLNRQINESDIRYKNLLAKLDIFIKKEQVEVPIDVHELQHALREKNYQIEILTKKLKLLEDAIDPRGIARNEQNIRIFLNMNINLPLAIQDFVHKYIRFDVFALDTIEREGGVDGLLHALIYSILDVTAQSNIMKKLWTLVKNQDSELQRLLDKNILTYIHNAMSMHNKDVQLQRYSLVFLATLSRLYNKNVDLFEKENICDAVVQSFLSNRGDKTVQKYSFTCLSYLLNDSIFLKKVLNQNIVQYIVNILSAKNVDPIVCEQGLATLLLLSDNAKVITELSHTTIFDTIRLTLSNNLYIVENNTVAYNTVIKSLFILQKCATNYETIRSMMDSGIMITLMKYLRGQSLYEDIVNQIIIFIKCLCAYNDYVPALLEYGLLDVCNISTSLYLHNQEISLNILAVFIKLAEIDPTNTLWFNDGINNMQTIENTFTNVYGVQEAVDNAVNNIYYQNNM